MTPQEFQINLGPQLKDFIQSNLGQQTISMVHAMKPNFEASPHEHIFIENRGAVRGYEMCIRNLATLSFAPVIKPEVQQDYGVKDGETKDQPPLPTHNPAQAVPSETQV